MPYRKFSAQRAIPMLHSLNPSFCGQFKSIFNAGAHPLLHGMHSHAVVLCACVDVQVEDTEAMEAFARRACSGPPRTAEAALCALKPHIMEDSASACLVALRICDHCVKKKHGAFLDALASDKWKKRLVAAAANRRDNQLVVSEAVMMHLLGWAEDLPNTRWGKLFVGVYTEIRGKGQSAASALSSSPGASPWTWKPSVLPPSGKSAAMSPAAPSSARPSYAAEPVAAASMPSHLAATYPSRTSLSNPSPHGVSPGEVIDGSGTSTAEPSPANPPQQFRVFPPPPTSFQALTTSLPPPSSAYPPPSSAYPPPPSAYHPPPSSVHPPSSTFYPPPPSSVNYAPPAYVPPPPPPRETPVMYLGGEPGLPPGLKGPLPFTGPQTSSAYWPTQLPPAYAHPRGAGSYVVQPQMAASQVGQGGIGPSSAQVSAPVLSGMLRGPPAAAGQPTPSTEDAELQWALEASREEALLEARRAAEHARAALREVEQQQEKAVLMLSLDTLEHHSRLLEAEGLSEEQMMERAKLLSLHELAAAERSAAAAGMAGHSDLQPGARHQQWATVQTDAYMAGGRMTVPHAPDGRPVGGTFQPSFGGLGAEQAQTSAGMSSTLAGSRWHPGHPEESTGVFAMHSQAHRKAALGRVLPDSYQGVARPDDAGGAAGFPGSNRLLASGDSAGSVRPSLWSVRDGSQGGASADGSLEGQGSGEGKEREPPEIPPEILLWVEQANVPGEGSNGGEGAGAGAGVKGPPRPPPPPPPPRGGVAKAAAEAPKDTIQRAPEVLELYRELNRPKGIPSKGARVMLPASSTASGDGQAAAEAAGGGVQAELKDKILGRSTYWKEVQDDVERHGPRIRRLSAAVTHVTLPDMDKVCAFVDAMEAQLSVLVDERAVLKSFEWPEAKMDALREAASTHRSLQGMERELQGLSAPDGPAAALPFSEYKAAVVRAFENVTSRTDAVLRQQDALMRRCREHGIPDVFRWMPRVRQAAAGLAQAYMEHAVNEAKKLCYGSTDGQGQQSPWQGSLTGNERQRERAQSILIAAVRLGFRAHQFAGGFTSGGLSAFNELSALLQALSAQSEGSLAQTDQAVELSSTVAPSENSQLFTPSAPAEPIA
eukprot:jgi/Mesvir1/6614/Mv12749-RA.2